MAIQKPLDLAFYMKSITEAHAAGWGKMSAFMSGLSDSGMLRPNGLFYMTHFLFLFSEQAFYFQCAYRGMRLPPQPQAEHWFLKQIYTNALNHSGQDEVKAGQLLEDGDSIVGATCSFMKKCRENPSLLPHITDYVKEALVPVYSELKPKILYYEGMQKYSQEFDLILLDSGYSMYQNINEAASSWASKKTNTKQNSGCATTMMAAATLVMLLITISYFTS